MVSCLAAQRRKSTEILSECEQKGWKFEMVIDSIRNAHRFLSDD